MGVGVELGVWGRFLRLRGIDSRSLMGGEGGIIGILSRRGDLSW